MTLLFVSFRVHHTYRLSFKCVQIDSRVNNRVGLKIKFLVQSGRAGINQNGIKILTSTELRTTTTKKILKKKTKTTKSKAFTASAPEPHNASITNHRSKLAASSFTDRQMGVEKSGAYIRKVRNQNATPRPFHLDIILFFSFSLYLCGTMKKRKKTDMLIYYSKKRIQSGLKTLR